MPIRISGINSGLDTEELVKALTSTYTEKKNKYVKAQTKNSWKQDAWKSLNSKVHSLYSSLGSLKYTSAYQLKKATSSNTSKVTVTAASNAANGTQRLQVKNLAKSGYLTGAKLSKGATSSSTLKDLGYGAGETSISVTANGKTSEIKVTGDTTVNEFVNKLKDSGVQASFDESNGRIFVSSKKSGAENDFALTGNDANGMNALKILGLSVNSATNTINYESKAAYALNTAGESYYVLDSDGKITYDEAGKAITNGTYDATKTEENILAALKDLGKAYADKSKAAADNSALKSQIEYSKAKENVDSISNETLKELMGASGTELNQYVDDDGNRYKYVDYLPDENGRFAGYRYYNYADGKEVDEYFLYTTDEDNKLKKVSEKAYDLAVKEGLVKRNYDENDPEKYTDDTKDYEKAQKDIKTVNNYEKLNEDAVALSSSEIEEAEATVEANKATIESAEQVIKDNSYWDVGDYTDFDDEKYLEVAKRLAGQVSFANDVLSKTVDVAASEGATRIDGEDAVFILNGAEFTSDSNSLSVNGLTIQATNLTADDEEITITTSTDTQGLYDKVKDFLSQYNSVINELNKQYNAEAATGYEPLTDEEKEEMSESEIEKWEEKIKKSLLRRDTTLGGVMTAMTNAMAKSFTVGGKSYSLATFGIKTLSFGTSEKYENYAYHIDGDSEDSATSGNKDKLLEAIANDPDSVVDFMKQLSSSLYDAIGAKMKSSSISSAYTVYNDKEMGKEYSSYKDLIKTWESRIEKMEDSYFKKFSKMESALSTLQSSTNSLTSMLGN